MKRSLLLASLILVIGFSAAQPSSSTIDAEPGLVKAGGLAYGLDVAWDNAMQTVGLKSPGEVAYERASELAVAKERNSSRARVRATEQLNEAVSEADNSDKAQLEKAESVLNNVSARVPEDAQQGVQNALKNVERAKQRVPEALTADRRGGRVLPDIEMPEFGGDGEVESPAGDSGPQENPAR